MHHAPDGPPLSARLAAAVARMLELLRQTRLVPAVLGGFVIMVFALAAPLPAGGELPASTAVLPPPSEGERELVPATGDGWTQDGRAPSAADGSASAAADAPVDPSTAPPAPTPEETAPTVTATEETAPTETAPEAPPADGSSTAGTTSSSPPSSPPSSSQPPSSSPPPSADPEPRAAPRLVPGAAEKVVAALDAARASSGCAPLTADADLDGSAAAHSAAMAARASLVEPPGAGAVAGALTDPAAVAAAWLADPAVPLADCSLTTAGVAVVDGWWTLLLA